MAKHLRTPRRDYKFIDNLAKQLRYK